MRYSKTTEHTHTMHQGQSHRDSGLNRLWVWMKVPHTKDSKIIQIKEKAKELIHLKIDCIFNTHCIWIWYLLVFKLSLTIFLNKKNCYKIKTYRNTVCIFNFILMPYLLHLYNKLFSKTIYFHCLLYYPRPSKVHTQN